MEKQNNLRNLVPKKPREPIIVLLISSIIIIIGLNLNFVSLKVYGFSFFAYKGYQLQYSLFLFIISFFLSLFACSVYYFAKSRKFVNLISNFLLFLNKMRDNLLTNGKISFGIFFIDTALSKS